MLKKIFISAVLLLAVLSFVVSMLKGEDQEARCRNDGQYRCECSLLDCSVRKR